MSENTGVNIDDLLDGTLDDLADAPSFKPFPAGAHKVTLAWLVKNIGDMPAVELTMKHLEVVELANPDTPASELPKAGDETSVAFFLKKKDKDTNQIVANEMGQGQWKVVIAALKRDIPELALKTNKEVMEATEGLEVLANTKQRIVKEDKKDQSSWKYYTDLVSVHVI